MDRNLGALSVVPSEAQNTRGLFYQWGRKDPFLPSVADFYDIPAILIDDYNNPDSYNAKVDKINELRPLANVANQQNGDGKRPRGVEKAQVLYYAPGNAQYAVENPEKFISIHSVYPGGIKCDWYIMNFDNDVDDQYASNLWGNTAADVKYKSIFDPCPAGYVVPKANAYPTLAADATRQRHRLRCRCFQTLRQHCRRLHRPALPWNPRLRRRTNRYQMDKSTRTLSSKRR